MKKLLLLLLIFLLLLPGCGKESASIHSRNDPEALCAELEAMRVERKNTPGSPWARVYRIYVSAEKNTVCVEFSDMDPTMNQEIEANLRREIGETKAVMIYPIAVAQLN